MVDITTPLIFKCAATAKTKQEIVAYIWEWDNGLWTPDEKTIPPGASYIGLYDTNGLTEVDLSLLMDTDENPDAPLLVVSQGVVLKKDLGVGGFISSNQGMLALGSGLNDFFDHPKIRLMHSELAARHNIEERTTIPTNPVNDQAFVYTNTTQGGFTQNHLYRYVSGSGWNDLGDKTAWDWKFDTLHLTKANDTTPAHLDLGNLTTHGNITVATPAIIMVGAGWDQLATGLLKYSPTANEFGIFTWGDTKPIRIGGSSVIFAAESGNPRCTIDGSGNMTVSGAIKSSVNGTGYYSYYGGGGGGAIGGAYIDAWGNIILNGGSWGHSWNVYNEYGNCILNIPDQGGVHFYDGLGNVKAGITNGGNLSVVGSVTVGVVQYLGYGLGTRGPLYVYASDNCYGGTISVNTSSERFKQNIEVLQDCSWLYNLRPVNFDWKDTERARVDGRQMGLIAEEVYTQNPQLVWLDESGQPEGVHYEWLSIPLLVELQKLRHEVDDIKAKMAA